jgi:hypothetical protein
MIVSRRQGQMAEGATQRRLTPLALVAIGCSGCSFAAVNTLDSAVKDARAAHADPERSFTDRRLACTESRAAPIVDTVLAGTSVATGIYMALPSADSGSERSRRDMASIAAVPLAILFATSAYWGFGATSHCIGHNERVESLNSEKTRDEER